MNDFEKEQKELLAFEKTLVAKFPALYRALRTEKYFVPLAQRGIEVDKGWWPLLEKLSQDITAVTDKAYFVQVKEKFGELRIYVTIEDDTIKEEVYKLIRLAEAESTTKCETCGADAQLMTNGRWLFTKCTEHAGADARPSSFGPCS